MCPPTSSIPHSSFLIPHSPARLSLDREHVLRGTRSLDWFFANRKWIRTAKLQVVECAWAIRPLPDRECAIRFLTLAPKRSYKRAHDRNRIKRWLRAAVNQIPAFADLESVMQQRGVQLLIMMRVAKPLTDVGWTIIVQDVERIAAHLATRAAKEPTA